MRPQGDAQDACMLTHPCKSNPSMKFAGCQAEFGKGFGRCVSGHVRELPGVSPDMCGRQGLVLAGQKELPVFQLVLLLFRQVGLNRRLRLFLSFFYTNKDQRIPCYSSCCLLGHQSRFDIFFKPITFNLHMKLFIAISTLNSLDCQGR